MCVDTVAAVHCKLQLILHGECETESCKCLWFSGLICKCCAGRVLRSGWRGRDETYNWMDLTFPFSIDIVHFTQIARNK
jgi:hypothetical protein